jgi:hypothetical protein
LYNPWDLSVNHVWIAEVFGHDYRKAAVKPLASAMGLYGERQTNGKKQIRLIADL